MALSDEKTTATKIVCESCDGEDAAQSRCNECAIFLCHYCTDFHKRSRSMKNHKLLTIEELKSNPDNIAEKMRCPKHKEELVKLFCKTCQVTTCRDCTIADHRQHEFGFVEEVAAVEKQVLLFNLNEVKERKDKVMEGIANLNKFNDILEVKKTSTISEIKQHFGELVKNLTELIESRKKDMIEKATMLTNLKKKLINAQLEVLEMALASCESSIEFTEGAFNNGDDVQILSMKKYILESLQHLREVKDQTKPCVSEEMPFLIPSSMQDANREYLNEYDVVDTVPCPENCSTSFKGHSITLICHNKDGQRLTCGGHLIRPSFAGVEVSDVSITDNEDGSYIIGFYPHQIGLLKFDVDIDGLPAPKCSLTKQIEWTISDFHGKGVISDGGLTMKGERCECEYSCRVGNICFESGVHTWKVEVEHPKTVRGFTKTEDGVLLEYLTDLFGGKAYVPGFKVGVIDSDGVLPENLTDLFGGKVYVPGFEVGVIDSEKIDTDMKNTIQRECVYMCSLHGDNNVQEIALTLDMDKRTLNITQDPSMMNQAASDVCVTVAKYEFTARRVSPFFACWSPQTTMRLIHL